MEMYLKRDNIFPFFADTGVTWISRYEQSGNAHTKQNPCVITNHEHYQLKPPAICTELE